MNAVQLPLFPFPLAGLHLLKAKRAAEGDVPGSPSVAFVGPSGKATRGLDRMKRRALEGHRAGRSGESLQLAGP